jgi:hypothetical protein
MGWSTTCRRCGEPLTAAGADDLVSIVEQHARDHGGAHGRHIPSREHILAHARHDDPSE